MEMEMTNNVLAVLLLAISAIGCGSGFVDQENNSNDGAGGSPSSSHPTQNVGSGGSSGRQNITSFFTVSSRRECSEDQRALIEPVLNGGTWAMSRFEVGANLRATEIMYYVSSPNNTSIDEHEVVWFSGGKTPENAPSDLQRTVAPSMWSKDIVKLHIPDGVESSEDRRYIYVAVNTTTLNGEKISVEACQPSTEPENSYVGRRESVYDWTTVAASESDWMNGSNYDWVMWLGGKYPWQE